MKKSDLRKLVREALIKQLNEADDAPDEKEKKDPEIEKAKKPMEPEPPASQDGQNPADIAHSLNLQYAGWGEWTDASGTPVAKTIGDKLVRIDNNEPMQTDTPEAPKAVEDPYADSSAPVLGHSNGKTGKFKQKDLTGKADSPLKGQPGKGNPPLDKNKNPIEVTVDGKTGYIDAAKDGQVAVTLHNGESIVVPKAEVKPVGAAKKSKKTKSTAELNADELDPKTEKEANKIFKAGGYDPYKPKGEPGPRPGWNTGMDTHDVPFDANGEATVQKLIDLIGDPRRVLRWLLKKYQTETMNGKSRIRQYIGILKDMGVLNGEGGEGDVILPA